MSAHSPANALTRNDMHTTPRYSDVVEAERCDGDIHAPMPWVTVSTENSGKGSDPLRYLNFGGNLPDFVKAEGEYFVRMEWGSGNFVEFSVGDGADIFADDANPAINVVVKDQLSSIIMYSVHHDTHVSRVIYLTELPDNVLFYNQIL